MGDSTGDTDVPGTGGTYTGSGSNDAGTGQTSEPVISNICFLKGTLVETDQGIVAIEKINPDIHTIDGYEVLRITQTITDEVYLIRFKQGCFGENKPSQDLVISQRHRIKLDNFWIEAKYLLFVNGVEKYPYNKETLYNIILPKTHECRIYNLICETLDPTCKVAKYFLKLNEKKKFTSQAKSRKP